MALSSLLRAAQIFMMAGFFTLFFLLSIFSQGYGTPTPQTSCPGKNVFGVSLKTLNTVSSNLRGGEILTPSDSEIDSVLSNAALQAKLTVIDFTATWCGPCRAIAPMFEALSEEIDDVVFVKCDVDETPGIAQRFSVRYVLWALRKLFLHSLFISMLAFVF
mmetsp:Transcript_24181/g.59197  ORF Transcript_24181/g.59197 Transcript_24181/m.59197 type:complete len:161 (+) Transcript_24181:3390-3872(+)